MWLINRLRISNMLDTISKPERWCSLKNIGMVEAERYIDGKTSLETVNGQLK